MKRFAWRLLPILAALLVVPAFTTGCGHTDEEMAEKQREIDSLKAKLKAAMDLHDQDQQKFADAQKGLDDLKAKLNDAQLGLGKSEEEKAKLRQAISEYEARLKQLDDMKARFRDLKARLEKLTTAGLKVVIRHNRMVIQLPGDVLFDSGSDVLKTDGKKVLKQVADIFNQDSTLRVRDFQVAGHTDNDEYGGPFHDNWGLALMRARQVLLFMVAPIEGVAGRPNSNGGGLDVTHWSAAGYGAMDPVAGTVQNQTRDDKQKNRRVELVLQPNVEEMLNLKDFGN
jgi:chemotaxis protein MotB